MFGVYVQDVCVSAVSDSQWIPSFAQGPARWWPLALCQPGRRRKRKRKRQRRRRRSRTRIYKMMWIFVVKEEEKIKEKEEEEKYIWKKGKRAKR